MVLCISIYPTTLHYQQPCMKKTSTCRRNFCGLEKRKTSIAGRIRIFVVLTTMLLLISATRKNARFSVEALSSTNSWFQRNQRFLSLSRGGRFQSSRSEPTLLQDTRTRRLDSVASANRVFRRSVATAAAVRIDDNISADETTDQGSSSSPSLLHPTQLGPIAPPKALSPSAVNEFKSCPQSYLFQYLYGLKQPTNTALAQGSMCHTALEQVFELPVEHRTLEVLQNLFRRAWSEHRLSDAYRDLFNNNEDESLRDLQAEAVWGKKALGLLENYMQKEDPARVPRPNPVHREVWVRSKLHVDSTKGVTGYTATTTSIEENNHDDYDSFLVRGIMDRLDMVHASEHSNRKLQQHPDAEPVVLRLIDYKTGKAPHLKYTPAVNERIQSEAFYQLLIYALLWRESKAKMGSSSKQELPLRYLRLFYLTSHDQDAVTMDMDLGATPEERDRVLQSIHQDLAKVWKDIHALVALQDPRAWKGCDRAFCYCHKCRPRFEPGTVWEPEES